MAPELAESSEDLPSATVPSLVPAPSCCCEGFLLAEESVRSHSAAGFSASFAASVFALKTKQTQLTRFF